MMKYTFVLVLVFLSLVLDVSGVVAVAPGSAPDQPAESPSASPSTAAAVRTAAGNFVVVHPANFQAQATAALAALVESRVRISDALGIAVDGTITVVLLPPATFRARTGSPPWVRGLYDGRIVAPVGPPADGASVSALLAVLKHELTHALLRRSISGTLPPWFEEGLAERFEGRTAQSAADWLRRRRAPGFEGLDAIDDAIRAGGWREDAGHQGARLALQALEELGGPGAAASLVAAARVGTGFAAALSAAVPGGRTALEARLRRPLSDGLAE